MSQTWCRMPGVSAFRGRASCVLLSLAALVLSGCVIFPHGAYWPRGEGHLAERADGAASQGAGAQATALLPQQAPARRDELQEAISRRWADDDLAQSAREMDAGAGAWVYGDVLQTIVWFYVDPVRYRELVSAGLESFRAALDNKKFCERFPEAGDGAKRAPLAEALGILLLKVRAADPWFSFQATEWLRVAIEKNRAMLGLPDGAVVAEMLFGAIDSLDPYTRFMTSEMLRRHEQDLKGEYTGIGATIAQRDGRFLIQEVFEGGAAAKAGLAPGDEITAIDGKPLAGLTPAQAGALLQGKAGTTLQASVRAAARGNTRPVTLTRAVVHVPAARLAQIVDAKAGIGYVRLTGFKPGAEKELRKAIRGLKGQGAKGLILDLRGNPGGSIFEAIGVVGALVARGRVLETRGRAPGATWSYDVPLLASREWTGPLAVLTDGGTASAAEIVAAALASHNRATVVGSRTFGKGAAQVVLPIATANSALCLTVARVYDPGDRCLEARGVAPDRRVAPPEEAVDSLADDPAVRAAVDALCAPLSDG